MFNIPMTENADLHIPTSMATVAMADITVTKEDML